MIRASQWAARLSPVARGSLYYLVYYGAGAAFMPFLAIFYSQQGLSGSEIGLLAGVGPLVALLVVPFITNLADRHGWRVRILGLGLSGAALTLLALAFQRSFMGFLPFVVLLAVFYTPILSLSDGIIAPMAARNGLAYGTMRLWGSLSWAVVAAAGGALWQQTGMVWMFPLAGLLFLTAVLVSRLLEEEPPCAPESRRPLKEIVQDGRFLTLVAMAFAMGLGMSMSSTFSGIYVNQLGGQMLVGIFTGIGALTELPVMRWGHRIMRRLGGPQTLMLSCALMGVSYLGMAVTDQTVLLLAIAAIRGLGFGLLLPTIVRMVAEMAPQGQSASYLGLVNAGSWAIAPLIASPVGGLIFDAAGPQAVFLACLGATIVAGLVLVLAQLRGIFGMVDQLIGKKESEAPLSEPG